MRPTRAGFERRIGTEFIVCERSLRQRTVFVRRELRRPDALDHQSREQRPHGRPDHEFRAADIPAGDVLQGLHRTDGPAATEDSARAENKAIPPVSVASFAFLLWSHTMRFPDFGMFKLNAPWTSVLLVDVFPVGAEVGGTVRFTQRAVKFVME